MRSSKRALRTINIAVVAALAALALAAGAKAKTPGRPSKVTIGRLDPVLSELLTRFEARGAASASIAAGLAGVKMGSDNGVPVVTVIIEPLEDGRADRIDRIRIEQAGARVDAVSRSYMRVKVPFAALRALSGLGSARVIRPPLKAVPLDEGYGSIVSQSVALTGAGTLQDAGFDGSGVKVAVVDLGFTNISSAVAAGEIPADYTAVKGNVEGVNIDGFTVHGTGVSEHLVDMAPGVDLYCILVDDEVDLQNAADYCRDNGIKVANHSVGWVNASYYDDTGPITSIINESTDTDGVFWAVSSGNNAMRHWKGEWYDPDGNDTLNFTLSDEFLDVTGSYTTASIFVNWDQYGNSLTDLDIYVRDKLGSLVAVGGGAQTGTQDPAEGVSFSFVGSMAPYTLQVHHYSGPVEGLEITIFSFNHNLEYAMPASSLMEPADAHGAFSVGAIYYGNYSLPDPDPESFSSQGPTNDGRLKPDITAPDGTSSFIYSAAYGTSFSSPTTAGAAALILQLHPGLGPEGVKDTLRAMALDIGDTGADYVFGAGKLNLDAGIDSIPVISSVSDIPGDEGLAVSLGWKKSFYDYSGSPKEISSYSIYRLSASMEWDSIASVPAAGTSAYMIEAATEADSTGDGGIYWSVFRVDAVAAAGMTYESAPDSGYSVDNLTPSAIAALTLARSYPSGGLLQWAASGAPDIYRYNIYRSLDDPFVPGPADLVHSTADTFWTDTVADGNTYYYMVSAVDDAGNESLPVSPASVTGTGQTPAAFVLNQNVPNPFNPVTTISFELPEKMKVRLAIYSITGKLVRKLYEGSAGAGRSELVWNGMDDRGKRLASGVYFCRLTAPGMERSMKMVLLR